MAKTLDDVYTKLETMTAGIDAKFAGIMSTFGTLNDKLNELSKKVDIISANQRNEATLSHT